MLKKISKIKGLGVFHDYTWDSSVPEFQKYNVIYGDNGSGKTTISRLLSVIENGSHADYPNLEYKIEDHTGEISHTALSLHKVRVFNADYVQQNIGQIDNSLKHILVVGEENKTLADELLVYQAEYDKRLKTIDAANKRLSSHEIARGKIFTAIAKTISEATSGSSVRNYRKNNAEASFINLKAETTLDEKELENSRITIRQDVMGAISVVSLPHINIDLLEYDLVEAGSRFAHVLRNECSKSATANAIQHLKDNIEISEWVESGLHLHIHKGDNQRRCEFCDQKIPQDRWVKLSEHFSAEDQYLKQSVEELISYYKKLYNELKSIETPVVSELYSDIRSEYELAHTEWKTNVEIILDTILSGIDLLNDKLTRRGEAIHHQYDIECSNVVDACKSLNAVITKHNDKTASFDNAKTKSRIAIENHYLSGIKADVTAINKKIEEERNIIRIANDGDGNSTLSLADLENKIESSKAAISNAHKAGERLTQLLQTFLGRKELIFKSGDDGYKVLRDGRSAKRLSEGEQTAIAFIYFIVQLQDRDFDANEGIVVIDDPVSSLDAGAIYQAFAFLKNAVKDTKQVFLLTHNFSFLRLLINWLQSVPKQEGKSQYYMLLCKTDQNGRFSSINKLDNCLVSHPTEYHYLFKVLANFQGDGTIASCYHIPNVTRKVLETFLDFYDPNKKSLYQKLAAADFDENKKTSIYKFSNDLSHFTGQGFEPGLVAESQKNTQYLLEMIQTLAPKHYQGMIDTSK